MLLFTKFAIPGFLLYNLIAAKTYDLKGDKTSLSGFF